MSKIAFLLFCILFLLLPQIVFAKIGVGVGTGKIVVQDKLKPGSIYELPSLTVFNTGDVKSEYTVDVAYHEKQPELRPGKSWFIFSPSKFTLEPGKAQEVKIKLNLPVRTEPGKYFAYLEGHPLAKSKDGNTTIGIAAAAKLYFTVVPGNIFEGLYYKLITFLKIYYPIPQIIFGLMVLTAIGFFIKQNVSINIGLKKKKNEEEVTEIPPEVTPKKRKFKKTSNE